MSMWQSPLGSTQNQVSVTPPIVTVIVSTLSHFTGLLPSEHVLPLLS